MRAIVITKPGGPEVLQIQEVPDPVPGDGEVLIRVKAFGVNHAETHMRKGEWPEATPVSGIEAVGTVVEVKQGTTTTPHTIYVKPGARLDSLQEVAVLNYRAPQRTAPEKTLPNVDKGKTK